MELEWSLTLCSHAMRSAVAAVILGIGNCQMACAGVYSDAMLPEAQPSHIPSMGSYLLDINYFG